MPNICLQAHSNCTNAVFALYTVFLLMYVCTHFSKSLHLLAIFLAIFKDIRVDQDFCTVPCERGFEPTESETKVNLLVLVIIKC